LEISGAPDQFTMKKQSTIFQKNVSKMRNKFCDAYIRLDDGKKYHVHKLVLARQSEFFTKLFKYDTLHYNLRCQHYNLGKVTSFGFLAILHWIYEVN
jgi:hypothetical protein